MGLVITSGYGGSQHLIPTFGYGGTSSGATLFRFDSAELRAANIVRARFTRDPNITNAAAAKRGNVAANYTLTGTIDPVIILATVASDDSEVIDLVLDRDLVPGDYVLSVADTVLSVEEFALNPPFDYVFSVADIQQAPISLGATNDNCENIVGKLLNPAFRGKAKWSALVAGIATGDCIVKENAQKAFNQLFVSTASGDYLTKRAADRGISKPAKVGISDDRFRQLVVSVANNKLVQGAFLEVLEILYGPEAVRGYAETGSDAPFVMHEGATLNLLIDETEVVELAFSRSDFTILRRATAQEVASVITRELEAAGSSAYAVAVIDPSSGGDKVRIFSGARGLRSSVRITSGSAQIALQFPQNLFPLPDPIPGTWAIWSITDEGDGITRWRASNDAVFNLAEVRIGDYLVVAGEEFDAANRGSWVISDVHYTYVAGAIEQWVDVEQDECAEEHVSQYEFESLNIFRPYKRTQYDSPSYAIVSQYDGKARVSLAATTQAVQRHKYTAAYAQVNDSIGFDELLRDADGLVTVTTDAAHGISPGQHFIIDDFFPSAVAPTVTPGTPAAAFNVDNEATGDTDLSQASIWSSDSTYRGNLFATVVDLDGDVWIIGGQQDLGTGGGTQNQSASIFVVDDSMTLSDTSVSRDYAWRRASITNLEAIGIAADVLLEPTVAGKVLEVGGYRWGPWSAMQAVNFAPAPRLLTKLVLREPVLVIGQLSSAQGLLAGMGIFFTSIPVNGDTIVVTNGVTTRTYGFGVGGDVTVIISATVAQTMINFVNAVSGDGAAAWSAGLAADLTDYSPDGIAVIYEKTVTAAKSALRAYGTWATQVNVWQVAFADNTQAFTDYSSGVVSNLPTVNPGFGRAGIHRGVASLVTDETHKTLSATDYRRWDGAAWNINFNWFTAATTPVAPALVADGALCSLDDTGSYISVFSGGVDKLNHATTQVALYDQAANTWTAGVSLKQRRASHKMVRIPDGKALVIGGRSPCDLTGRTALGFVSWDFEDVLAATTFDGGPVDIARNGNARPPGKHGFGVQFSAGVMDSNNIPEQTALNTALLGDWTISGWTTTFSGCLLRNSEEAWADEDSNTLIAFGVDPADDKFFVRWQYGAGGTTVTNKTTATRTALLGSSFLAGYPRYHHFAITKAISPVFGITATFTLYIDGVAVEAWTGVTPSGGGDGIWSFGSSTTGTDAAIAGVFATSPTTCIDLVGLSPNVLTAREVRQQFYDEVGVMDEPTHNWDYVPVGRVLNSCEIVDAAGYVSKAGPMATARFAFGCVALPDGRVIVAGGIGYNPSTDTFPYAMSQRQLELSSAEIYDPSLGIWTPLQPMAEPHSYPAMSYDAANLRVYIAGGFTSTRTEYLDLTDMTWKTSSAILPAIRARSGGGGATSGAMVLAGGSVPTLSAGVTTFLSAAHDEILGPGSENLRAGGINDEHLALDGTTGSTIVFSTPGRLAYTASSAAGAVVTAVAAAANLDLPGPFIFDAQNGFGVSATSGTSTATMQQGSKYSQLTLGTNEALAFPDSEGYLVFDYGYATQVGPVRYLSRISDDSLSLDASFKFPLTVPAGATVSLVSTRSPFVPSDMDEVGGFYLTASPAGRVAAIQLIKDISAAGIELEIDVRYPGDRGLGGEGLPDIDVQKLTDAVWVWGSDDLDREMADLREGNQ